MSTEPANPKSSELDDEGKLIRRIRALEDLLACYRVGKNPSEKLFAELGRTEGWYVTITNRRSKEFSSTPDGQQ